MKVELIVPFRYFGTDPAHALTSLSDFDPQLGLRSFEFGMHQCDAAFAAGFDSINVTEHHHSSGQMTGAPHLLVAALGQRLPTAQFGIYGTDLLLHNPVHVAEQYAVLDNLVSGRLRFGLMRGTPHEYATYGTNPWESRERFEEAVELLQRVFCEPEPFGWEGRHYRFRNIAVIPKPFQRPHPRILLPGSSVESARFAGRMGFDVGIAFAEPSVAARSVAAYRESAAIAGWQPTPENILYRQFVVVAESDEKARELLQSGVGLGFGPAPAATNSEFGKVMATVAAALKGAPKGAPVVPHRPPLGAGFVGSPQTVLAQMRQARDQIGMGRVELAIFGQPTHEDVMATIDLLGRTIVDPLHADEEQLTDNASTSPARSAS
jgi:alkanesulfonate monooxygenase SsuD/methylene tetrahydromethanopterin reductase-like flavin-dependent oxidoreductase (luciferase family)